VLSGVLQPYRNYWIVYDPHKKLLHVIRVIHAARYVPQILK